MERFHRNDRERDLPRPDALREAQTRILKNARVVRGDVRPLDTDASGSASGPAPPYDRAGFQLSGDWR